METVGSNGIVILGLKVYAHFNFSHEFKSDRGRTVRPVLEYIGFLCINLLTLSLSMGTRLTIPRS